ncbi:MAG: hypothetical protein RLN76_08845 [Phycisphaeraceae bacterium]
MSEPIVVVSGIPRSGTSLMMQALDAGGVPSLSDGLRSADPDNPRGYYELEPVKKLATPGDHSWLEQAPGHVIKVIHSLVRYLPTEHHYKIIMLHRDLDEVLASQAAMLQRLGKTGGRLDSERLKAIFRKQMEETVGLIQSRPEMDLYQTDYRRVILEPQPVMGEISQFLGGLDVEAMVRAVDPSLYRQRR